MNTLLWIWFGFGVIGAYAMSLTLVTGMADKKREMWFFVFPGAAYVIGFSVLGFVGGLWIVPLFRNSSYPGSEGLLKTIEKAWSEDPAKSLLATILFCFIWGIIISYFVSPS